MKVGDLATLHSGGPRMTIEKVVDPPPTNELPGSHHLVTIHCVWTDDGGRLQRDKFDARMLRIGKLAHHEPEDPAPSSSITLRSDECEHRFADNRCIRCGVIDGLF